MSIIKTDSLLKGKNGKPLQIAGPCSAETKEQVLETARRLHKSGKVDILRAGIWKPRTMPGSFEGIGAKGLLWMQEAREETGLPVTVEVAKASHVDLCLEFGIDVLWIGARTTVSPFAMEELANALKGVDIPVMVKNPINPDLKLWIGGMERLRNAGISQIAAIHRGFSYLGEKYYDLDFDGLMIESHITPDDAWTDASQQITPEVYAELIDNLVRRDVGTGPLPTELEVLRSQITNIDEEILNLLSNRMDVARNIGEFKKENNISIYQKVRWAAIQEKGKKFAAAHNLNEEFVTKHFQNIHDESINQQERVMRG